MTAFSCIQTSACPEPCIGAVATDTITGQINCQCWVCGKGSWPLYAGVICRIDSCTGSWLISIA